VEEHEHREHFFCARRTDNRQIDIFAIDAHGLFRDISFRQIELDAGLRTREHCARIGR
jgi:hypothetical protein